MAKTPMRVRWLDNLYERFWSLRDRLVASALLRWRESFNPKNEPIEPRIRVEATRRLAGINRRIDPGTARVVLEAQVEAVRILREASGSLDTKANVVIVASGALLTAFVTISPAEKAHIPHWAQVATLAFLACAFLAGIAATYVVGFSLPTPAVYNRFSTLTDPRNEGKICSELAEAWYRYGIRERRTNTKKANRVTLGFAFVTLALLVLVVGAVIAVLGPEPAGPTNTYPRPQILKVI
ncbi:MAG TPA: hypothetical protein VHS78_00520 [Candidatus Elarobacter sp.]|jgi:hypothetical protein|nr:hypothetical protein [Candidatus Elarobacter sp.]